MSISLPDYVTKYLEPYTKKKVYVTAVINHMPQNVKQWFDQFDDKEYIILCWKYNNFANDFDYPKCLGCGILLSKSKIGKKANKQFYCSTKCSYLNVDSVNKRKATMKRLYGGEYSLLSPQLFDKMHNTQLERYGKRQYNKDDTPKIKRTKEESDKLRKNNMMNKYGVVHQMQLPEIKLKSVLHKRTIEYYNKNQNKFTQNKNITIISSAEEFLTNVDVTFKCNVCNNVWSETNINYQNVHCKECAKHRVSKEETKIKQCVDMLYASESQYKFDFLGKKSIDIFIPELKLGFEYNGSVWHSTKYNRKNVNCHQFKTIKCLEHNIKLFQIFDFKWNFTRVSRLIEDILMNYTNIVMRRDCINDINRFNKQRCYSFIDDCIYSYGCYINNKLRAYAVINSDYQVKIISHNKECSRILINAVKNIVNCFAIEINLDTESPIDYDYKTISINSPEIYYYANRYRVYDNKNKIPDNEISTIYKIYGCGSAILTF